MKGKTLFLYGNSPEPLPVLMMNHLREVGWDVWLLYYDRGKTQVSLPMSDDVMREKSVAIRWPVGENPVSKAWNRLVVLIRFARSARQLEPDVLHAWNFDMLLAGILATLGRRRTRLIFGLQDTTRWMTTPWGRLVQRIAYRRVDCFFVTSLGFRDAFLRRFRLVRRNQPVTFLPNVPQDAKFRNFSPRFGGRGLEVGHIGLLRGEEGIETLIDAVLKAREEGANIRLFFAGKGPAEDLVRRASEEHDFIEYTGPYRHDQEIGSLYGRVDVLYGIYDRSYDKRIHLAYRFCEAVNCRLPIIVAKGTHMAEQTDQFKVGRAVPLGDVKALAETLKELADPDVRRAIAENCESARSRFVFETFEDVLSQSYEQVAGSDSEGQ